MIPLPKPQKYAARLASIEKISSKVYRERFELLEPKEIIFFPGQTVMLMVAPGVNRSMSLAGVPDEKNSITLIHDVAPMGPYSKWALSSKVGDPMSFMGPLGMFVLDKESPRSIVLVATGTGIAPYYAMAKNYLSAGGRSEVTMYWGLRHEEDLFWQKEFAELASQYPNFHPVITLSQPTESWQGKQGHVQDHILSQQNLSGADYYLCGNRAMVDDVRTRLKAASVPETQIKSELFY